MTGNGKTGELMPEIPRDENGKWVEGVSGNPRGRPKGSKNRVTILKIMAEEAVRENNTDKMLEVCKTIIEQALDGNTESQKLVWNAIMSKGLTDSDGKGKERVEIKIGRMPDSRDAVTITGETTNEEQDNGE